MLVLSIIGRWAINSRHSASDGAKVGGKLAAMMNRIEEAKPEQVSYARLKERLPIDDELRASSMPGGLTHLFEQWGQSAVGLLVVGDHLVESHRQRRYLPIHLSGVKQLEPTAFFYNLQPNQLPC